MRREVKVQLTLSEGYQERFRKACIRVAMKRVEGNQDQEAACHEGAVKTAEAV